MNVHRYPHSRQQQYNRIKAELGNQELRAALLNLVERLWDLTNCPEDTMCRGGGRAQAREVGKAAMIALANWEDSFYCSPRLAEPLAETLYDVLPRLTEKHHRQSAERLILNLSEAAAG